MRTFAVFLFLLLFLFFTHLVLVSAAEEIKPSKVVYLTFDADMTPFMKKEAVGKKAFSWYDKSLVSYLETEHIPATLFVTGMFAQMYGPLVRELAHTPGIVIGNHTYDHAAFEKPCYKLPALSTDQEKKDEIIKTQEILTPLIGYAPQYFRYPGLCHNASDDSLVRSLGLVPDTTDLASGDAFNHHPKNITNAVLRHVHDGSVIVMHLGGHNAPSTGRALREIVPALKSEGYEFRAL